MQARNPLNVQTVREDFIPRRILSRTCVPIQANDRLNAPCVIKHFPNQILFIFTCEPILVKNHTNVPFATNDLRKVVASPGIWKTHTKEKALKLLENRKWSMVRWYSRCRQFFKSGSLSGMRTAIVLRFLNTRRHNSCLLRSIHIWRKYFEALWNAWLISSNFRWCNYRSQVALVEAICYKVVSASLRDKKFVPYSQWFICLAKLTNAL